MRSVVITGSGSGIGAATARRLAAPDTGIVVHAKSNRAGCEATAEAIRERGGEAEILLGDLAEVGTAAALIDRAERAFGGVDVLIANAGFPDRRPFGVQDLDGVNYCYDAIARSFFLLATAALPYLARSKAGRVVAVSAHSAHIFRADYPTFPGSVAAKLGLEGFARALAIQLAPQGVTVNVVVPGIIRKPVDTGHSLTPEEWNTFARFIPAGRLGEPEEVAAVIAFLVSAEASYVTSQIIHVNGGMV